MISDLNLYQVFYTVAKHQNFSYAAEALYISQPAISKSMKLLESQLQLKLFTRTSKGVLLTPEGELLYLHIQKALGHINEGDLDLAIVSTPIPSRFIGTIYPTKHAFN